MVKRMNEYDMLVNYLQEQHNEVFHQWANIKEQLDILEREVELQRDKDEVERKKPKMFELVNWCEINKKWLESLHTDNIKAILLSIDLMVEAAYDGNIQKMEHIKQRLEVLHLIYLNFMLLVILKMEGE